MLMQRPDWLRAKRGIVDSEEAGEFLEMTQLIELLLTLPLIQLTQMPQQIFNQSDGHNCGPIACLKFMDLFNIMPKKEIEKCKLTYRQLVTKQYSALFEKSKFDLVIAQRTSFYNIVKGIHIVCMCHGNDKVNSKEWRIMKCCGYLFHYQCISDNTSTTGLCPACGHDVPPSLLWLIQRETMS